MRFPRELSGQLWPRRLKSKGVGSGCALWFMRLFILPHTLIGMGLLLAVPGRLIWMAAGENVEGRADEVSRGKGSKGHMHYSLRYHFSVDGFTQQSRSRSISSSQFTSLLGRERVMNDRARIDAPVTVRTLGVGPWRYSQAILPDDSLWGETFGLLLMAGFWNGVLSVFIYTAYIQPWQVRRLYRRGLPVEGIVTGKRTRSTKGRQYYVLEYRFDAGNMVQAKSSQTIPRRDWEEISVGQTVTVLHWPGRKRPSVIYEFGPYFCVE